MTIITDDSGKWEDYGTHKILVEPSEQWLQEHQYAPTVAEIDAQVVARIRERYDQNEEYKMLRVGIKDPTNPDFMAYDFYVEECRAWGQAEKQKYGLTD